MKKRSILILMIVSILLLFSGCGMVESTINDLKGSLIGNGYDIYTYDNYGDLVLQTSGDKISITGNKTEMVDYNDDGDKVTSYDLSSVITITMVRLPVKWRMNCRFTACMKAG